MKRRCKRCGRYQHWTGCHEHGALYALQRWTRRRQMIKRIDRNIQLLFAWNETPGRA